MVRTRYGDRSNRCISPTSYRSLPGDAGVPAGVATKKANPQAEADESWDPKARSVSDDLIRARAFELYWQRGGRHGHGDDWLGFGVGGRMLAAKTLVSLT